MFHMSWFYWNSVKWVEGHGQWILMMDQELLLSEITENINFLFGRQYCQYRKNKAKQY